MNKLLLVATLLPVLAGGAGLLVLRLNRRDAELEARIRSVTRVKVGEASMSITRANAGQVPTWKDRASALFGFKLSKRNQYGTRWQVVLIVSLVIGRVATGLALPIVGMAAWALTPIVWVLLSRAYFSRSDGKRQLLMRAQLPDALGLIVRAVRVGVPVTEALRAVALESPAPTGPEFKELADEIAIGVPLDTALRDMAMRNDLSEYSFFAAALGLQAQTGGALTETLDVLADVTRKRVALRARGRALSAEARTSAIVIGALPLVMTGLLFLISPDYISVLFTTQAGNNLLGLAVLLLVIGGLTMQTIIQNQLS
ncbi:MAG: type II secretion system F family protein [Gemmatimonadaceae bacterium]|nr:type II secretion system F family protein [Acetobacteraceae bacterium]